jgi:ribose transport system substrate-binding protein
MNCKINIFRIYTIFLTALLTILLVNCALKEKKVKVAFVVRTLSNPFFVDMINAAKVEAERYPNVELIIQSGEVEADIERQGLILDSLIALKVEAICVTPCDSMEIISAIKKAKRAGIPMLLIDTRASRVLARMRGAEGKIFIGSDHYLGGKLAGEYIVKKLDGAGNIAIIDGGSGEEIAILTRSGFLDYVKQFPKLKVAVPHLADWDREKGTKAFQNLLRANPSINAVFACNDEIALGAAQAIRTSQKRKEILVIGFGGSMDAFDAIKSGYLDATIAKQPAEMGRLAILNAVKTIKGEEIPSEILTQMELITKESFK